MTEADIRKLADEHALSQEYTPMSTYHSQRKSYEAGFNTCLTMVRQVMRRWPDMPAGDWDNKGELLKFMDNE